MQPLKLICLVLGLFVLLAKPVQATTEMTQSYYKAQVKAVETHRNNGEIVQKVIVIPESGSDANKEIVINYGESSSITESQMVHQGEKIVLLRNEGNGDYWIVDFYRMGQLGWLLALFFVLVILTAGKKGFGSFAGMGLSLIVIIKFMVPEILAGKDPLIVSLIGSLVILVVTLYLAHGVNKQTTVSLVSTLAVLLCVGFFSTLAVGITRLTGMGDEDAAGLRFGATEIINLKGLLLGSMIIGVIGVLDDITTGQVAAVWELKKANMKLSFKELIKRGRRIGTEHIASLVNTLVMAYAGAAMPVFIFLVLNPSNDPLWVMLNSELIAEEFVRMIVGSMGLVLAVPITTVIAAWYVSNFGINALENAHHKSI